MEEDFSAHSSESTSPLKDVSILSSELTTKERLSICCKPSFQLRRLKNRGATLILIWSYICLSVLWFYVDTREKIFGVKFSIHAAALGLTLPIAGWIADVRFGRYRVMHLSMWIMWAALLLTTVSSVLAITVESYTSNIHSIVNGVLWTMVALGLGGFLANVVQFGIDQLHDASTNEITSFILWYAWTYYSSGLVVYLALGYFTKRIIGNLMMCIYLSVALSSMLMFNHWLVKEPVTQNPFGLVYSVVRYAIKHKHPECRSAFTYCEDEPPSRIDFGKSKYGGPFTTEQVEDVKTFLRFIVVMPVAVVTFGVIFASWLLVDSTLNLLNDTSKHYSKRAFSAFFINVSFIILPLYEFFFYPVFHRCLEVVKSSWKFIFGNLLLTAKIVAVLVIEIFARRNHLESTNYNASIPCIDHATPSTSVDLRWMAVPLFLDSLSTSMLGIGALEFITSQTPYSMRGLVMGTAYYMLALCVLVVMVISIPFTKQFSVWGTGIISCGFWYALLLLVVEVLVSFILIAILRWYKKRKREDVLPNEHFFAERYYDRDT